jgi:hypothetical protein
LLMGSHDQRRNLGGFTWLARSSVGSHDGRVGSERISREEHRDVKEVES